MLSGRAWLMARGPVMVIGDGIQHDGTDCYPQDVAGEVEVGCEGRCAPVQSKYISLEKE